MRLSITQSLQHTLKHELRLAPRMIQSMEILQLPLMELQERIQQEMEENPVLSLHEADPDLPDATPNEGDETQTTPIEQRELVVDEKHTQDDFDRLVSLSQEWDDHFEGATRISSNRVDEESDRKHDAVANLTARPQTLQDALQEQLAWHNLDAPLREMTERIIYNLDSNGYLAGPLTDLLPADAGPEQLALAERALAVVQQLDPPGVGARNLQECLLLQLKPEMPFFEELRTLISSHLEELRDNRLPAIQRKTGYSLERIQEALEHLRQLQPKPGAEYYSTPAPTVTPDLYLEADENGHYQVRLDDGQLPSLYISRYYRTLLERGDQTSETKDFIKKKITSAQWLIESIEQRRSTLMKVAQAIVDHQTAFLDHGPERIEPLKMQQIADKVGVHVTTVSRAVDDKWIQTPRGLFPLKRFFGGGTVNADGDEVAWDAVRLKLQEIIDQENKRNPFSDDDLVKELAQHGLTVARRTVTKYRKAMSIPSSRQRRNWTDDEGPNGKPSSNGHAGSDEEE